MKALFLLLLMALPLAAQFPFDPATGQWLQTNDSGGVNIGYFAGNGTPEQDTIRIGFFAGANCSSVSSLMMGRHAGYAAQASQAIILGHAAGQYAGKGGDAGSSVILGYLAGRNALQLTPHYSFMSVQIGNEAGTNTKNAQTSVLVGSWAGRNTVHAVGAVVMGFAAGYNATNAQNSVLLGNYAGYSATNAQGSVFIGDHAASAFSRNYSLVIDGHPGFAPNGTTALIYGEFDTRLLRFNAQSMGFFGAAAIQKPVVTGSWSDGTAQISLAQALHALGLINNQTTP